jgi:hypothetical protein
MALLELFAHNSVQISSLLEQINDKIVLGKHFSDFRVNRMNRITM